jgi:hypothetical protein
VDRRTDTVLPAYAMISAISGKQLEKKSLGEGQLSRDAQIRLNLD